MNAVAKPENNRSFDSPSLRRVDRGALCSGCGGCALIAPGKISMTMQAPGYLRPQQSEPLTRSEEDRIAAICPGLGQAVDPGDRIDDPMWGPYVSMRTGHAVDSDLRFKASSGGALSAILTYLVETDRVDAVLHTGADPKIAVANAPIRSTTADEILKGAGSRYAPSAPLAGLAQCLDGDHRYAFVGKPCDVAALRALAGLDPRVAERFPIMVSFFCGGVPSQTGAEQILHRLGTALKDIVAFRYRGFGWPGRATATLADGSELSMTYHDSWGQILSYHAQHRCKICADGTGVAADIVCADAWESDQNGYPVFEERDGTSLIVARTASGDDIVAEATAKGYITAEPFDVMDLTAIQPGQVARRRSLLARLAGLAVLGRPIPRYRGLNLAGVASQNGIGRNLKNFLGIIRRVLQRKVG